MGESATAAQFAAKIMDAADNIAGSRRKAIEAAALVAKGNMLDAYRAAGVGQRLRGVGKAGARVGVRYDVKGHANPTALVKATGPVHLANNPTSAHVIQPRPRRGKKAITPGGPPRARAMHPGTRGKGFWQAGRAAAEKDAPEAYMKEHVRAVRRAFR